MPNPADKDRALRRPLTEADVQLCRALVVNAPQFFADPEFRQWLLSDTPKFSWCRNDRIDEWSDVVVLVDPSLSGEGSDADMPGFIWDAIVALCRDHLGASASGASHHMVRLTNLAA